MKSAIDTLKSPAKLPKTGTPTSPFELELALGSILQSGDDDDEFVQMALNNFKTDDRLRVAIEVLRDRSRLRLGFGEAYPRFLGKAYAFAYAEYLLAGTLSDLSTDDLGLSMLGLLASVPFGFVQFVPTVIPDPNVPFVAMGGDVGGKVVGQPFGRLQSVRSSPYRPAAIATPSNVSYPGVSPALSQRQTQDDVRHTKQQDLPVLLEGLKCRDPQVRIKTAQMMDSSARAQKPPCRP